MALLDSPKSDDAKIAVVLDDTGHLEAAACCEELMERGLDVTYVTRFNGFAPIAATTSRDMSIRKRLHKLGRFTIMAKTLLLAVKMLLPMSPYG